MKLFKGILLPSLYLLLAATCNTVYAQAVEEDPALAAETVERDPDELRVTIADPFIELHTGPGQGYPIFYVIDRGVEVRVLRGISLRIERGEFPVRQDILDAYMQFSNELESRLGEEEFARAVDRGDGLSRPSAGGGPPRGARPARRVRLRVPARVSVRCDYGLVW